MTIQQQKAINAIIKSEIGKWPNETKGFQIYHSRKAYNNNLKTYMNYNKNAWGWAGTNYERKIIDKVFEKDFKINEEGYIEIDLD